MENAHFRSLVQAAMLRDCSKIVSVHHLQLALPTAQVTALSQVADDLYEIRVDFIEALETIRARTAKLPRSTDVRYVCPDCGDPYCLRAMQVQFLNLSNFKF